MVAGESYQSCNAAGFSAKVTRKSLFMKEMQICKLREKIKKETDPKIKLIKCERLDDCIRELTILQERLEGGTKMVPKVQNWGKERKRETRAQSVRRRETIGNIDIDNDIVEQRKPVRHGGADTEGSLHPDTACEGSESAGAAAVDCEPANKGLSDMDSNGNSSGVAVHESALCTDIVYDTALEPTTQTAASSIQDSEQPAVNGEHNAVNGVHGAEPSAVHTGAGHSGVSEPPAEETTSTAPPADRPQYRRLFSNVAGSANSTPLRKNAVRIRYTGPEESIPSRLFMGKVLLKEFMRFEASEVFALIHIPSSRIYDISFKLQYSLDLFWNIYNDTKGNKIWENLQVIPLSKPQVVTVTILFQSEVVALADLMLWLSRQCVVKGEPEKIYDEENIWNGGYTVKIQLLQYNGLTRHLPHSFYLGSERGICYYPGQPRLCHRCGGRHLAINCSRVKCSLCGQFGHVKDDCTGPVVCNLCSGSGHTFRGCPHAEHNKCGETVTEAIEEEQEDTRVGTAPEVPSPSVNDHQSTSDPAAEPAVTSTVLQVPAVNTESNLPSVDVVGKEPVTSEPEVPPIGAKLQVPAASAAPIVTSEVAALQVSPATEETNKESRKPVRNPPEQPSSPSIGPADPTTGTSMEENRIQYVKRKNFRAVFRKVLSRGKPAEPPALEITSGRYSALGEEDPETPMEQVPSSLPDDKSQDDPGPSVSTKRWGTTGHSSGRKKKTKKPK